jgi:BirA family transcriptional regulator, biotin operon repressor / biotin---[acetyl-CoA-carboxylase] ligase
MHQICLDTIDSTQDYAKKNSATFSKQEITCVTAELQTAGRGRQKRPWISPKGVNILATFYFQLPTNTSQISCLAHLMTYSLTRVLIEEGLEPKIKWPNDIQLNQKKLAGVLCEVEFHQSHIDVYLGIGINVNLDRADAEKIDQPATSLKIETKKEWDRKELLTKLQVELEFNLKQFKKEGFSPFYKPFNELLAYKGQMIKRMDGVREWAGICHSVNGEGALTLLLPDGSLQTFLSGEITRL